MPALLCLSGLSSVCLADAARVARLICLLIYVVCWAAWLARMLVVTSWSACAALLWLRNGVLRPLQMCRCRLILLKTGVRLRAGREHLLAFDVLLLLPAPLDAV